MDEPKNVGKRTKDMHSNRPQTPNVAVCMACGGLRENGGADGIR